MSADTIHVRLNGKPREIQPGHTVHSLLESLEVLGHQSESPGMKLCCESLERVLCRESVQWALEVKSLQ